MAGNTIAALTPLLLAGTEVGVVHRQPDQVGPVMVQLGGESVSQLGDFRLVLLADVDPPGRGREEKGAARGEASQRVKKGRAGRQQSATDWSIFQACALRLFLLLAPALHRHICTFKSLHWNTMIVASAFKGVQLGALWR